MERRIIARVVERHVAAPVTGVTHLPSSVNEVFLVSCSGGLQMVARFNTASELERLQKEAWCIARSAAAGVPGPTVVVVGGEGGHAFMLQTFIPGRRGDALRADERPGMWRDLGGHLRRIHGISVSGFGEDLSDLTTADQGAGWRRYLDHNVSALTAADPLLQLGVLNEASQDLLRGTFERLARSPLRFGLSHGDPSPWNVIRGDDGALHVLDWSEAHAHVVPHYDFGVILDGRLDDGAAEFRALLDGYGWDVTAYEAIRGEILDLRLLVATDKVRWALDRRPERIDEKVRILTRLLRQTRVE